MSKVPRISKEAGFETRKKSRVSSIVKAKWRTYFNEQGAIN